MSIRTLALSSALALVVPFPSGASDAGSTTAAAPMVKNLAEVKFEQVADVAPCVTAAVLNGDPSKGASTLVMKASSGCKIPWHWHSSTEEVTMTAGVGRVQMKDGKPSTVRAGTYAMIPAHHVHQFTCTASCTLFLHSDGVFDTHYVNAAGAEIPAAEALKTATPAKK